jgi:membrane-bound ClpP family serine protease
VVRSHRSQPTTGREELKGKLVTVKTALRPEGLVMYRGELWTAVIDNGEAKPGEEVIITKTDGLKLVVSKEIKKETEGGK